jgi:hypothetical protein
MLRAFARQAYQSEFEGPEVSIAVLRELRELVVACELRLDSADGDAVT